MRKNQGFTLVEILIVVVILGILAAIVIPQFSDASTQSKLSSCQSSLQSLRSQIQLYKIQHNDNPPTLALFEAAMTQCSNATAAAATDYQDRTAANVSTHPFGPYIQQVPVNPWNTDGVTTVAAADAAGVDWVYDEVTGDIYIGVADLDATADADVLTKLADSGASAPVAAP